MNLGSICGNTMAGHISGIGVEQTQCEPASSRELLEYIVKFFSYGNACQKHAEKYDKFAEILAIELYKVHLSGDAEETLIVEFLGHRITFLLSGVKLGEDDPVTITVSKKEETIESTGTLNEFQLICRVLLIRQQFKPPQLSRTLTDGGNMDVDLKSIDFRTANLQGFMLAGVDLSGVNLSGANLHDVYLEGADLSEVSLVESELFGAYLDKADLSNFSQEGSLLKLPVWDAKNIIFFFKFSSENPDGNLLSRMDSIDEQFASVKLRMARELIASLEGNDVSDPP